MFQFVADIHLSDIGNLYWEKKQRHAPSRILKMSVKGVSTVLVVEHLVMKASHESSH